MVNRLWQAVLAPTTRTVYSTGYNTFRRFLALSSFPAPQWLYPVTEDFLIYFVAHCYHVLKLQHSTIQTYFAGNRFTYIEQGFTNPLTTPEGVPYIRLQMLLKSVKKISRLLHLSHAIP